MYELNNTTQSSCGVQDGITAEKPDYNYAQVRRFIKKIFITWSFATAFVFILFQFHTVFGSVLKIEHGLYWSSIPSETDSARIVEELKTLADGKKTNAKQEYVSSISSLYTDEEMDLVLQLNFEKFQREIENFADVNKTKVLEDRWNALVGVLKGKKDVLAIPQRRGSSTYKNKTKRDEVIQMFNSIFTAREIGDIEAKLVPVDGMNTRREEIFGYYVEIIKMPDKTDLSKVLNPPPLQSIPKPLQNELRPVDINTSLPKVKIEEGTKDNFGQLPYQKTHTTIDASQKIETREMFDLTLTRFIGKVEGKSQIVEQIISTPGISPKEVWNQVAQELYSTNYDQFNERFIYGSFIIGRQLVSRIEKTLNENQNFTAQIIGNLGFEKIHYIVGYHTNVKDLDFSFALSNYQIPFRSGRLTTVAYSRVPWLTANLRYERQLGKFTLGMDGYGFVFPTDRLSLFKNDGDYDSPMVTMNIPPSEKTGKVAVSGSLSLPVKVTIGNHRFGVAPLFSTGMNMIQGNLTPTVRTYLEIPYNYFTYYLRAGVNLILPLYEGLTIRRAEVYAIVPLTDSKDWFTFLKYSYDTVNPYLKGFEGGFEVRLLSSASIRLYLMDQPTSRITPAISFTGTY